MIERQVDLGQREAGNGDIELKINQSLQFECQQPLIPAGIQRELVVGQDIGPPLLRRQMRQPQHRHLRHADLPGRQHPPVARDDLVIVADKHRIGKAEAADAVGDLGHLFAGVNASIALVGTQPRHRCHLDPGMLKIHVPSPRVAPVRK